MRPVLLVALICLFSGNAAAQNGDLNLPDSQTLAADTIPDTHEAGGITAAEAEQDRSKEDSAGYSWLLPLLGGVVIGGAVAMGISYGSRKKTPATPAEPEIAPEPTINPAKNTASKSTGADAKKLKQELRQLMAQLESVTAEKEQLEKSLNIYRNFDSNYYNEAFRKLVGPMNEALENGSRPAIMENLLKMMAHFSSLTRYKIAKKQPYDETNIHYLLNQKGAREISTPELNAGTPPDKTPKNIKTLADLLKEQGSGGLDDSIIAGYRIKDL